MLDSLPPPSAIEASAAEEGGYVFRDESVLGTRLLLYLVARNFSDAQAAALAARNEIDRLNHVLNAREEGSELSLLNRSRHHIASPELFEVIADAERWRVETAGAYTGRLGNAVNRWMTAEVKPSAFELTGLALAAEQASVEMHSPTRTITRTDAAIFALEGMAKGWIVDRAYDIAMSAPGIAGALIDIGGDIRCGGRAPSRNGWCIGIPDPTRPFENAPLVSTVTLQQGAVATSGLGVRDHIVGGARYSPTLNPLSGWPVDHHLSVTALADTAAEADMLATAMLVSPTEKALQLAGDRQSSARITLQDGRVVLAQAHTDSNTVRFTQVQLTPQPSPIASDKMWQSGWQALATFTAPRRQLNRDPSFRSPYMAMWITDLDNKPVRTLILIGKAPEWQKDNYIWWAINKVKTDKLVATRSMSTSGAGVYNVFWDGVDDLGQRVRAGKYLLHVETSRERGLHTYRSLELNFETFQRFKTELPPTEEGGGLRVSFDHY
jgi:thiamine biosynthesis lipoprotein